MAINVDNPHFIDGYEAYHAGLPEVANPFLYLANPFRLWRYGYRTAGLVKLASQGIHHLPGDDIEGASESALLRIDKLPFDQGRVGYAKGLVITDCPYGPDSQDYKDWQAGWLWQELRAPRPALHPQSMEKLSPFAWLVKQWANVPDKYKLAGAFFLLGLCFLGIALGIIATRP